MKNKSNTNNIARFIILLGYFLTIFSPFLGCFVFIAPIALSYKIVDKDMAYNLLASIIGIISSFLLFIIILIS